MAWSILLFLLVLLFKVSLVWTSICYDSALDRTYCSYGCCHQYSYNPCCSYYQYGSNSDNSYKSGLSYNNYDSDTASNTYKSIVNIGAIVGGVIGGLTFIGIVISVICCCVKKSAHSGQVVKPVPQQQQQHVAYSNQGQQPGTNQAQYGQAVPPPYSEPTQVPLPGATV